LAAIAMAEQNSLPLLGICLGHQCLGQYFGGKIIQAPTPVHGKPALINHNERHEFLGLTNPLKVARYHSLVIEKKSLPNCLEITSESLDGLIMSVKHQTLPFVGLQFHPESVISEYGKDLLSNFINTYL